MQIMNNHAEDLGNEVGIGKKKRVSEPYSLKLNVMYVPVTAAPCP